MDVDREFVAHAFLSGQGLEIGALHMPLSVPPSAVVRYVDRFPTDELRKQYPELGGQRLVDVDIVTDGEHLDVVANATQDFIIANHFLEHCQDPIGALRSMFRVLKPGGILYLAIPDKRCSFDADRPVTTLEHLLRDHSEGPAWSRRQHFEEWARLVNKVSGDEETVQRHVLENMRADYSIHYHVWTPAEMLELMLAVGKMVSFEFELYLHRGPEVIFVLRNGAPGSDPRARFAALLDRSLTPEPWCIDRIMFDGRRLEMVGWALAPGGRHANVGFTVNDAPFDHVEYPMARADVATVFWYKPGADRAAFRCWATMDADRLFAGRHATIKCIDLDTGRTRRAEHNWYFPDDWLAPPLPDAPLRKRASGSEDEQRFRLEGYTTFTKLDLALRQAANRGIAGFPRVLDWGCGCGRVARYFHRLPDVALVGIDVDSDNVDWCCRHLGFATFLPAPLHPPTDFHPSSFDLVVGVSVFAHLAEPDQRGWLEELRRVTRPGAYLLLSVLGEATACQTPWDLALWERWQDMGILSTGGNEDLKGVVLDGYYCNTYMTSAYIRRAWAPYFTVVDIIPAYIGNQQDLVVLRNPA